jgi:hypothetical protein
MTVCRVGAWAIHNETNTPVLIDCIDPVVHFSGPGVDGALRPDVADEYLTLVLPCPFCGCHEVDPHEWMDATGDQGPCCPECGAMARLGTWQSRACTDVPLYNRIAQRLHWLERGESIDVDEFVADIRRQLSGEPDYAALEADLVDGPVYDVRTASGCNREEGQITGNDLPPADASTLEQESARYRWLIENATISTDEFTHIGSWSKADKITLDAAIDDLMRRIPLRSPAAHPVNAPSALTDDSAAP